ncbi:MAG: hypothetical protein WA941_18920 [Nitrososphaeraceae archaeon]
MDRAYMFILIDLKAGVYKNYDAVILLIPLITVRIMYVDIDPTNYGKSKRTSLRIKGFQTIIYFVNESNIQQLQHFP